MLARNIDELDELATRPEKRSFWCPRCSGVSADNDYCRECESPMVSISDRTVVASKASAAIVGASILGAALIVFAVAAWGCVVIRKVKVDVLPNVQTDIRAGVPASRPAGEE